MVAVSSNSQTTEPCSLGRGKLALLLHTSVLQNQISVHDPNLLFLSNGWFSAHRSGSCFLGLIFKYLIFLRVTENDFISTFISSGLLLKYRLFTSIIHSNRFHCGIFVHVHSILQSYSHTLIIFSCPSSLLILLGARLNFLVSYLMLYLLILLLLDNVVI